MFGQYCPTNRFGGKPEMKAEAIIASSRTHRYGALEVGYGALSSSARSLFRPKALVKAFPRRNFSLDHDDKCS